MKRLLLVFVVLLVMLVGCQSVAEETTISTAVPENVEPTPIPPAPTDTAVPPTDTPIPPTEEPDTLDLADLEESLQAVVDAQVEAGYPGVVLLVDAPDLGFSWQGAGGMADAEAGIPMETDTPFRVVGMTGMMQAVVVLRLNEEGLLNLDDPISQYLDSTIIDQLSGPDGEPYGEAITVGQLLNATSGVAGYFLAAEEDMDGNNSDDMAEVIINDPDRLWLPEEVIAYSTSNLNTKSAPGEKFNSCDLENVLISLVIESVTGMSLDEAYQTWLFEPLGMSNSFLAQPGDPRLADVSHVYFMEGVDVSDYTSLSWLQVDVISTVDDLKRFMWDWVNDDVFTDPASKETMVAWTSMAAEGYDGIYYGSGAVKMAFGEWDMPEIGDLIGHVSLWNAFLFYWPQYNIVYAGTLNQARPFSTYPELAFPTMMTILPYVQTE
ncbi:MAG: beta-lactamase family protein [Ardenticatenaceae bacterium]|nr:beta-lactamase family protein [Ardenticatenaceae bacterium]MCB9446670.1 beta-lactamase family protein [Ardenticatenaceae bacterium]